MHRARRSRILATLGPASSTLERIRELAQAGADVFRLNFSHGAHADHAERYHQIRQVEAELDRPIGVLMDLQGPKLRVGRMAGALAAALGLPDADQRLLRRAAVLHDLGKLALPRAILDYAHVLDRTRRRIMQQHALLGAALLAAAREPWLRLARSICLCHHERWDGSGYPAGLAGAAIPLAARLTSVVDVYDALRSQRCYKRAMDHAQAMAILLQGDDRVQPAHFDPEALQALQRAELTVMQIHDALPDPTAGHG